MMPVEEIKLIASFRVDLVDVDEAAISEIHRLFKEYRRIMNELIEHAHSHRTTSFISLHHAKYHELRQRYPTLPSHYIDTTCRHAASIYKSFIKMKEMGMCEKEKPVFKKWTIWLDDHLFKLDVEGWRASIAVHGGRWVALRLLHGKYHDKFKSMRLGEAQLVLKDDGNIYLNVFFRQAIMLSEVSADARSSPSTLTRTSSSMATTTSLRGLRRTRGLLEPDTSSNADGYNQRFAAEGCGRDCWRSIGAVSGGGSRRYTIGRLRRLSVRLGRSGPP